jgi:hypothetical protein
LIKSCYCNVSSGLKFHCNIDEDQGYSVDMRIDHNTNMKMKKKNHAYLFQETYQPYILTP